jgi:vacuolar-type H+-ATPase subunit I/STV1
MADENRFAGLGEQIEEEEEEEGATQPGVDEEALESTDETDATDEVDEPSEEEVSEGGPAFGFDATTPKSIYVREETLELLEDTEFGVESILRQEYDVRNVTGREFHDAMVHVLTEHVDEIAARIHDVREDT